MDQLQSKLPTKRTKKREKPLGLIPTTSGFFIAGTRKIDWLHRSHSTVTMLKEKKQAHGKCFIQREEKLKLDFMKMD